MLILIPSLSTQFRIIYRNVFACIRCSRKYVCHSDAILDGKMWSKRHIGDAHDNIWTIFEIKYIISMWIHLVWIAKWWHSKDITTFLCESIRNEFEKNVGTWMFPLHCIYNWTLHNWTKIKINRIFYSYVCCISNQKFWDISESFKKYSITWGEQIHATFV